MKIIQVCLWKNSLGIPLLNSQEEAVFQQCPLFRRRKYYKLKMTYVLEYVDAAAKHNFMNDPKIKELDHYKPIVELGPMIAATFPHEEIGRYPTEINTSKGVENSVELYKNHKVELLKLINTADLCALASLINRGFEKANQGSRTRQVCGRFESWSFGTGRIRKM